MEIKGTYDSKFAMVAEEFEKNFKERGEIGASVSLTIEGETVVDLWAGKKSLENNDPWEEDTMSIVWSSTKGATALCAHLLNSQGKLDVNAPVAKYWPEFAQKDKENITVSMLLNHQAGLPTIRKQIAEGDFYNWDRMIEYLEQEEPFWEPGTQVGYHALTYGWLVGEVVRRVSGKSLGQFFQDEVAKPLDLAFWIGLPKELESKVAKMIMSPPNPDVEFYQKALTEVGSIQNLIAINNGGYLAECDSSAALAAEIGAAGGVTNARGLAKMYAPLANEGKLGELNFIDKDIVAQMGCTRSAIGKDASLLIPTKFSLGYAKSQDNRHIGEEGYSIIMSEDAFGHPGNGGSVGFASPNERLSFGYTMNKMGDGVLLNGRGQSLIDATYKSLGYRTNKTGNWLK